MMLKDAVSYDAERLIELIKNEATMQHYEDAFLWPGVLHKTRVDDMEGLRPVLNDLRDDFTALAATKVAQAIEGMPEPAIVGALAAATDASLDAQGGALIELERDREKTKQLQLQIELAKLQLELTRCKC